MDKPRRWQKQTAKGGVRVKKGELETYFLFQVWVS